MPKVCVIVDTTTTAKDTTLAKTPWMQLLSLAAQGRVELLIPEVVLRETERHRQRAVDQAAEIWRSVLAELPQKAKRLRDLSAEVPFDSLPAEMATVHYDGHLAALATRDRLARLRVRVLPLPTLAHEDLLERDLSAKKPFTPTGKGYRDALVWASVVEFVRAAGEYERVIFVTGNSSDFCDVDGNLHEDLREEIASFPARVTRVADVPELLRVADIAPEVAHLAKSDAELAAYLSSAERILDDDEFEERPMVSQLIEEAVLSAVHSLVGEAVSLDPEDAAHGVGFEQVDFPYQVSDAQVVDVHPQDGAVEWQTYETYETGTLLVRASVAADVTLEGFLHKGDFHVLDSTQIEVLDWDWNDYVAQVQTTARCRLVFQLRVEEGAGVIEDVQFDQVDKL